LYIDLGAANLHNKLALRVHRGGRGKEGEMTQTMYAHMNKIKIFKKRVHRLH
jgi:hypothetical protein